MSEQPRNWDKELADIDKVIARQGSPPSAPAPGSAPGSGPRAAPATRPVPGRSVALTWFWVLLALALAAALPLWPYPRRCGLELVFFLGAAGVTAVVALLGALTSWSHRRGLAHVFSLLVLAWAAVAAAREVLPRVGYARQSLTWLCSADQPAPAQPAPAQPAPAVP